MMEMCAYLTILVFLFQLLRVIFFKQFKYLSRYLLPDRARNGKQKTPVVKNTVNPSWSHILVFDGITPEEIPERSLELTVWDHEKLGTNEFLGGVRLNTGLG